MNIVPMLVDGQSASHGGHHEQYGPFQSAMCKRWDTRVQHGGLKQDDGGGVLLAAPSALCGSPVPAQGKQVYLCLLPHGDGNFHVSDLTSQTRIGFRACLAGIIGKVCQGVSSVG